MSSKIDKPYNPGLPEPTERGMKLLPNAVVTSKNGQYYCCCCNHKGEKIYIPVPRSWGSLTGNIYDQKDLIELLQSITLSPADKEVISVMTYSATAPSEPEEGARYANSTNNTICTYQDGEWVEKTPSKEAIYITDDTIHMYAYDAEKSILKDVIGQAVDNTIYVNDLEDGLNPYTDDGIYSVCYTYRDSSYTIKTDWYSLTIMHRESESSSGYITYTQILKNKDGYAIRYSGNAAVGAVQWSKWQWYRYLFEGRNEKKPHIEVTFSSGNIYVRDRHNAIKEDDYLVLYYWNRHKRRITAFAGGERYMKIFPVRWGSISATSLRKEKGWRDDWRRFPYTIEDIMQRITGLTPSELNDLMWDGGYLKKTLLGSMSFVGGTRGNGYSTKLWIGVARGLTYSYLKTHTAHFRIDNLMHRIPFYIQCLHIPSLKLMPGGWPTKIVGLSTRELRLNLTFDGNGYVIKNGERVDLWSKTADASFLVNEDDVLEFSPNLTGLSFSNNCTIKKFTLGSRLKSFNIMRVSGLQELDSVHAMDNMMAEGESSSTYRQLRIIYDSANTIISSDIANNKIRWSNVNNGTLYVNTSGQYFLRLLEAATQKGWTVSPLPEYPPSRVEYVKGFVNYTGSHSRKPHIYFDELPLFK